MSKTVTPAESSSELRHRLRACRRLKLSLLAILTIAFCGPYLYLGHHAFFPLRQVPTTMIDSAVPFDPRWVWVYQSIYLMTSTLPWLATRTRELRNYVIGFALMCAVCFLIYLFFPTAVPRPPVHDAGRMYALLLFYDGPFNAFPSLHAGFLYYTLAFARRVYGRVSVAVAAPLVVWSLLILVSTLATREHYALDLAAGLVLGSLCDLAAWSNTFRSKSEKSHAGLR